MMNEILSGNKPSTIFRSIVDDTPTISNIDLASSFREEFRKVDPLAMQVIWRWRNPGRDVREDDDQLDTLLLCLLRMAKYVN
ncbi:hypothetical protein GCM10009087_45790 [Sphingomonas oligophenolica]|uniref:Uncharacterized protein n=1 Tax=Sphingomonas oligophenolica TaxID=301154 RepID=A0ABU9Y099_9SPHN